MFHGSWVRASDFTCNQKCRLHDKLQVTQSTMREKKVINRFCSNRMKNQNGYRIRIKIQKAMRLIFSGFFINRLEMCVLRDEQKIASLTALWMTGRLTAIFSDHIKRSVARCYERVSIRLRVVVAEASIRAIEAGLETCGSRFWLAKDPIRFHVYRV